MRYHPLILLAILVTVIYNGQAFWPFTRKKSVIRPSLAEMDKRRSSAEENKRLSPVIFVPGDGGSQLEARLNKSYAPNIMCAKKKDWYSLWLNLDLLLIPAVYCWVDNIKLVYDNVTRTTQNIPGVNIRVPGWGDPRVVEWIDPTMSKPGAYFKHIGNALVKIGYKRGKNMKGAPYDFRKGPSEQKQFFIDLKKLVEDTYEENHQTRVTFLTHSMGSSMTLLFLQQQSVQWKEKYIERQISLAGAWAGSMKALKVFAMGDNLQSIFLYGKILREEQITHPSLSYLLPSPLFWKSNEVLVQTPSRVYTMAQMDQYLNDIHCPTGWLMREDNMKFILNFSPPGVELHCLYGDGLKTVERLQYKKDCNEKKIPKQIMGPGDGTVNQRSLRACHHWTEQQSSKISTLSLKGVDHMGILKHHHVLNYIKNVLKPPKTRTSRISSLIKPHIEL